MHGISDDTRHPIYWFDDGSLILRLDQHKVLYRLHKSVLTRHSPAIPRFIHENPSETTFKHLDLTRCSFASLPDFNLRVEDLDALLAHLYHDATISLEAPFSLVAPVLRCSSPDNLDFPAIHKLSRRCIENMFPSGPRPFVHPDCLEEALELASEYNIPVSDLCWDSSPKLMQEELQIRKGVLYSLVTTSNFDTETEDTTNLSTHAALPAQVPNSTPAAPILVRGHVLSASDARTCRGLMKGIMEHFTPILFTPTTTSHMACTDVFAETWMQLVIQPAIENDGVYKPLETLQSIIDIDWGYHGLCSSCVVEKRAEWRKEQEDIWEKIDNWIV